MSGIRKKRKNLFLVVNCVLMLLTIELKGKIMEENLPSRQTQPPIDRGRSKKWVKIAVFILGSLFLMGGIFYAGIRFGTSRNRTSKPQADITPIPSPTPSKIKGIITNKVFYPQDNNIFSYDVKTKQITRWTDYPKNKSYYPAYDESGKQIPYITIENIKVIDGDTLGFGKCEVVPGDFGCGLYTLNLKTRTISERMKLDKEDSLLDVGWLDESHFAYLVVTNKNNGRYQFYLANDGDIKKLIDLSAEGYGRGGFIEDSREIEFSPSGNYFFLISTALPPLESFSAFAVHGYDSVSGQEIFTIQNATMPVWLDNQKIVFRKYISNNNHQNGIYIYDIATKEEKKIVEIPADSYQPSVIPDGKIVFWTNSDKNLWIYNLENKEKRLLVDKAISGFWVSPTMIAYEKIELCDGKDDCMLGYRVKSVDVFDLESNTKIGSIPDLKSAYRATSEYNK